MRIEGVPFTTSDWTQLPVTEHPGETGTARWRALEIGNIRMRVVEYTPGYRADHWCERGHVVLVLEGELVTELASGESHVLRAGQSYLVAEGAAPHRSHTSGGATLFVVD